MSQRTPLPKICIALGFTDPGQLVLHAKREAEAGERFLDTYRRVGFEPFKEAIYG